MQNQFLFQFLFTGYILPTVFNLFVILYLCVINIKGKKFNERKEMIISLIPESIYPLVNIFTLLSYVRYFAKRLNK
jgi:hypothetical protein